MWMNVLQIVTIVHRLVKTMVVPMPVLVIKDILQQIMVWHVMVCIAHSLPSLKYYHFEFFLFKILNFLMSPTYTTGGQPVLHTDCLRGHPFSPPSTEAKTFSCKSANWLLILSTLTIEPLYIDGWSCLYWLLTLSTLTVDPLYIDCWSAPPRINRGDHLFMQNWKLTVDPLCVDSKFPPLPPRINRGNHLFMQKWKLTVDPLHVNHQFLPPQVLITSVLIVDPPQVDY